MNEKSRRKKYAEFQVNKCADSGAWVPEGKRGLSYCYDSSPDHERIGGRTERITAAAGMGKCIGSYLYRKKMVLIISAPIRLSTVKAKTDRIKNRTNRPGVFIF